MILIKLFTMALIGALIGWMTNIIAIKLLFRPLQPIDILGFKLQGLIPKRREEIAHSVATTIERELLDMEQILDTFIEKMDKRVVLKMMELKISDAIVANLPSVMKSFRGTIDKYLHDMIEKEGDRLLSEVTESLLHRAVEKVSIADIVERRLKTYDIARIETIVLDLTKRELVQIERLGGILGFIVGIIQGILVLYVI